MNMLKVVEYNSVIQYTLNMKRGDRYVGVIGGKRHWKALECGHPVTGYNNKWCWGCWKPNMGKSQIGVSKPAYARGVKHHSWRGGRFINPEGYVFVRNTEHNNSASNGYIAEHRLVMSKHIGRDLEKGEEVHHINHDKTDNRIENLMLFSNHSEHIKYEHKNGDRKK
jgi:hypothetical protein